MLFVTVVCVAVACGSQSWISPVTGALDRVLFDAAAEWVVPSRTSHVAVVHVDPASAGALANRTQASSISDLLRRLDRAASVTLEPEVMPSHDIGELSDAIAAHGRIVLALPAMWVARDASTPQEGVAGAGHRQVVTGHLGAVRGFVPWAISGASHPHAVLESMRVARKDFRTPADRELVERLASGAVLALSAPDSVPQYALGDVIRGGVPDDAFDGKMVFVGRSGSNEASFRTSSIRPQWLSPVQVEALMAEAVVDGGLVQVVSGPSIVILHLLMALTLVLICSLGSTWRLHLAVMTWFAVTLVMPVATLAMGSWVGLGVLPIAYALIYAYFAWENLHNARRAWRQEVRDMQANPPLLGMPLPVEQAHRKVRGPAGEIRSLVMAMRRLQRTAISMIDHLPHPVLIVRDHRVLLWNENAARIMASTDRHGDTRPIAMKWEAALRCAHGNGEGHQEIRIGDREMLMLETPFCMGEVESSREDAACRLLCLVDIAGVKEGVTQSRQALTHMAHDMRSPLSTMLALIEEHGESQADAVDPGFLEDLRRQADYSLRVASEFLALSRAEQMSRVQFSPVVLRDLVEEAVDQCQPEADRRRIVLQGPSCVPEEPMAEVCADLLVRAFVNVIDNAIKYSADGSIVDISLTLSGHAQCVVRVVDQGEGIAPEHLDRLFEPFYRAGRKGLAGGVGLGLPFVQRVVQQHGGSVCVTSDLGVGTTFELNFQRMVLQSAA